MSLRLAQADFRDASAGRTRPPAPPALSTNEVHLWLAHLDGSGWRAEDLVLTLSADELRRADAFAYAREQRRFVVGRALLRRLLARYLRVDPAAVGFAYGPYGKPDLASKRGRPPLRFNCAHSGPLALYAIAARRRVGIDVEALRPLPEAAAIAQLCFSPRERATLAGLPQDALEPAVLRAWTLKEAYVKATGEGLALAPEQVEVAVVPGAPPALHAVGGDARLAACWSLRSFDPVDGYTAALAVEGRSTAAVFSWGDLGAGSPVLAPGSIRARDGDRAGRLPRPGVEERAGEDNGALGVSDYRPMGPTACRTCGERQISPQAGRSRPETHWTRPTGADVAR